MAEQKTRGRKPTSETASTRSKILEVFNKQTVLTSVQIQDQTGCDIDQIRKSLRYFEKNGIICRTSRKKTNAQGQPPIVWKLKIEE